MSAPKFKDADRVIVSQTPVDQNDTAFSGQVGAVVRMTHRNAGRDVYDVLLDEDEYEHAFYDQDLLPYNELEALRAELAEAEAKVVSLKEAIKVKERDATELPVATVVSYKDTYGASAMTKQGEDSWLNVFPTRMGNVNTENLTDYKVTELLTNRSDAVVRKP